MSDPIEEFLKKHHPSTARYITGGGETKEFTYIAVEQVYQNHMAMAERSA